MDMVKDENVPSTELEKQIENNREIQFRRIELLYNFDNYLYKYAFSAKDENDCLYSIPLCAGNVMRYDVKQRKISFIAGIQSTDYAYTGGIYDKKRNCIWGIPRNSNNLLKIHIGEEKIEEIPLGLTYNSTGIHGAHHYSGVIFNDSIYSPPRNDGRGILKIDLKTVQPSIIPVDMPSCVNYSGSLVHPNGKIYFFPSPGNYIISYDPKISEFKLIGDKIYTFIFGGDIWKDGNIYCVTSKNIIRINVQLDDYEVLYNFQNNVNFYGCAFHLNGRLYAFGHNNNFIEYDPALNRLSVKAKFYDGNRYASTATMGLIMNDGNLYLTPCRGRFFMKCVFD